MEKIKSASFILSLIVAPYVCAMNVPKYCKVQPPPKQKKTF